MMRILALCSATTLRNLGRWLSRSKKKKGVNLSVMMLKFNKENLCFP